MSDIMDEGVTMVDNLEKRRQPMPTMEAIYIISPTQASIDKVKADFEDPDKPMYAAAHIYVTYELDNMLIHSLKQSAELVARTKALRELYTEFLTVEHQVYNMDLPEAFHRLYTPSLPKREKQEMIGHIVERLLTLCVTLGERPLVRYKRREGQSAAAAAGGEEEPHTALCEEIATKLERRLKWFANDKSQGTNSWWQPDTSEPSTILIVERASDALAPLVHEYTYQAMVQDIIGLDGDKYTFKSTNAKGEEAPATVQLNDDDPLWPSLRHLHIADAIDKVLDDFNNFIKNNKAASMAKGGKDDKDLKALSEVVKSMPQFNELMKKYSMHIDLTKKCMAKYEQTGLEAISTEEQNMVMGEDPQGKPVKSFRESVGKLLGDPGVSADNKLRLVMIFCITQELNQADVDRMLETAGLAGALKQAVSNLALLGVKLKEPPVQPKGMQRIKAGAMGATKLFPFMGKSDSKKPRKATDVSFDLARYRPALQFDIQDALESKLDKQDWPSVTDPADLAAARTPANKPRGRAGWADKGGGKKEAAASTAKAGPRLLVFVAGGVSFSEMRAAYELSARYDREVIIGSTELLTPERYLRSMAMLNETLGATASS